MRKPDMREMEERSLEIPETRRGLAHRNVRMRRPVSRACGCNFFLHLRRQSLNLDLMCQTLKQSAMSAMAAVAKVGDEIALPQKRVLRLACPNPDSIAVPLLHHLICEMLSAELKAILQILSCRVTITLYVRCRMSLMCTQYCQTSNDRYIEGFLVPFQGELRSVATKAGRTHACAWIWRHLRLPHPCFLPVENQNHESRSGQNIHRMMGSQSSTERQDIMRSLGRTWHFTSDRTGMQGDTSRADRSFKAEQAEKAIVKDWSRTFEGDRKRCERLTEGKADEDGRY